MHEIHTICERRGVNCSASIKHEAPAAACHPTMIASLVDACRASEQVALHQLVSSLWIMLLQDPSVKMCTSQLVRKTDRKMSLFAHLYG
jgi:hypothetical protein